MSGSWLGDWLVGDLTRAQRIWSALLPGVVVLAYFLTGLVVYLIRYLIWGPYDDEEMRQRGSSVLFGSWGRYYFAWVTRPVFQVLVRTGLPPFALTVLSLLLSMGSAVSVAVGRFALGGWLYLLSGLCDFLDGRLARNTRRATPAGAALDSILDRYAEGFFFAGLAWFYRDTWVLAAVLAGMMGSFLTSYTRARGEGLGVQVKVGLMQRAERIVYMGLSIALSPVVEAAVTPDDTHPMHRLAVLGICVVAAGSWVTAIHRLLALLKKLDRESSRTAHTGPFYRQMLKNSVAAVVATLADFALVLLVVECFSFYPVAATALGCLLGGIVNFLMNQMWTFGSKGPGLSQVARYAITSVSTLILNSSGVSLFLALPGMDYRVAWVLVRIAVFFAWSFPLMRVYVFQPVESGTEQK